MRKLRMAAALLGASVTCTAAQAKWRVQQGPQVFGMSKGVGATATVSAKGASNGIGARLQLECFVHPDLMSLYGGIVFSKPTPPGAMPYRIQFDDAPPVQRGPFTRLNLTQESLRDEDRKILLSARRLRITFTPTTPPDLSYEFDVSGAAAAAKTLACREYRRP
jgi:hypothetical protein